MTTARNPRRGLSAPLRTSLIASALIVLGAAALCVFDSCFEPDRAAALAGGVQAIGVVAGLVFAAVTLRRDSKAKRVDRVLELHAALVGDGPVQQARVRLVDHLRWLGGGQGVRRVTRHDLEANRKLRYRSDRTGARRDINCVLRHLERCEGARRGGSLDDALFHELVGLHALWWQAALEVSAYDGPLER